MLDWLIVGGGLHGTLISRALIGAGGCCRDRIGVLDPYPEALHRWSECAKNTGMHYLRSSLVHHLDDEPQSLDRFAATEASGREVFAGPYRRPSLSLFDRHSRAVIERWELRSMRVRGWATGLERNGDGLRVETSSGVLEARRVILAIGTSEQPQWPRWATELNSSGAAVHHIFDPGFHVPSLESGSSTAVIGGGISALQVAQSVAASPGVSVRVISRHTLRVHDFDTDSGWFGPLRLRPFLRLTDPARRREVIDRERHRGSAPADVARRFLECSGEGGDIELTVDRVAAADRLGDRVRLKLVGGATVEADSVLLATGFDPRRPGGSWLDSVIERLELECGSCGYPVVGPDLRWGHGIYVTGPLAELELGPTARNIYGARSASQRLAEVARS